MEMKYFSCLLLSFIFIYPVTQLKGHSTCELKTLKAQHILGSLSNHDLRELAERSNLDRLKASFFNIYKIRTPSTPQHKEVQKFIENFFQTLNWQVVLDEFSTNTVDGPKEFTNIVAIKNPSATRRLALACHYDSKKMSNFYAASDSAVPCAIMLDLAETLNQVLESVRKPAVTLELIFFDGEEAFMDWTEEDSLYGSRHLAARWQTEPHGNKDCFRLDSLDLLVLLDLLGPAGIKIHKFESGDSRSYDVLRKIEKRARKEGLLRTSNTKQNIIFSGRTVAHDVGDDHQPFLQKNVPVLHIIPLPFPSVWHTTYDTESNVSWDSVMDLDLIFKAFVLEYLDLHL